MKMMENGKICYESNDALYVSLICVTFLSAKSEKTYENGKLFTDCSIALRVDFLFPFRNTTVFITKIKKYLANGEAFRN